MHIGEKADIARVGNANDVEARFQPGDASAVPTGKQCTLLGQVGAQRAGGSDAGFAAKTYFAIYR